MHKEDQQAKQKEVRLLVEQSGKDKEFYLTVDNDGHQNELNGQKLKLSDQKGWRLLIVGDQDRKLIVENDQRQRFQLKLISLNVNPTQNTLSQTPKLLNNKPITYQQLLIAHNTISSLKQELAEQQSQIQSLRQQLSQAKQQSSINEQTNNQNKIHEKKQQHEISFPQPVPYDSISFLDDGKEVSYTDCWEISLLRFLHLLFGKDGKIDQQKLTKLMDPDDKLCQKLIQYFRENPTYEMKRSYYTTKQGYKIRAEWAQFLNRSGILHLKKPNEKGQMKYQVAATVPNLITFFSNFFPQLVLIYQLLPLTYSGVVSKELFKSYSEVLQQIYRQFSSVSELDIKFKLSHKVEAMEDMIWFSSVQHFSIKRSQEQPQQFFQWEIYEYYECWDLDSSQREIVKRFTGHSDYRFGKSYL